MRRLHRPELWSWSRFDAARNVDFNGLLIVRDQGNVVIDPMPLSEHDAAHLDSLGPVAWVVITNSDHVREAVALAARTGAQLAGPAAEADTLGFPCDRWLTEGDTLVEGLTVFALEGSKTPGELALLLDGHTLITGDLIRAHHGGSLMMLPAAKLTDEAAAIASVRRMARLPGIEAVLVGDGWPVFRDGGARLTELANRL